MNWRLYNQTSNGFSLIELLIASAIGLFLMGAIMQVFTQSRSTVSINQSVNEIQDRGRSLLHHLTFNIKQRGYQGCLPPLSLNINDIDDIDWDNTPTVNPLANALPDAAYSITSLRGFEVNDAGNFSPVPTEIDMIAIQNGETGVTVRPNSDVLHIEFGDRRSINLSSNMSTELSAIEIANNTLNFAVGDLIMIGDCTAADIVAITNIVSSPGSVLLEHSTALNRSASLTKPYETNAQVRQFHSFTYFVANTGRTTKSNINIYSLYRSDHDLNIVELADGIEFLQLSYKHQTSLGVQDLTADHTDFNTMRVIGIDIGLLIAGLKDVLQSNDTKTYRTPGATIGPHGDTEYDPSQLLKATFRSYVDLKNRA